MKKKQKIALEAFYNGHNCAQSIVVAYSKVLNFDVDQALNMMLGFGGGMGKLQQTCGAVTASYMLIGIHQASVIADKAKRKESVQNLVQEFHKRFIRINHTDQCSDLIKVDLNSVKGNEDFYKYELKDKVCTKCLTSSIEILDGLFEL